MANKILSKTLALAVTLSLYVGQQEFTFF